MISSISRPLLICPGASYSQLGGARCMTYTLESKRENEARWRIIIPPSYASHVNKTLKTEATSSQGGLFSRWIWYCHDRTGEEKISSFVVVKEESNGGKPDSPESRGKDVKGTKRRRSNVKPHLWWAELDAFLTWVNCHWILSYLLFYFRHNGRPFDETHGIQHRGFKHLPLRVGCKSIISLVSSIIHQTISLRNGSEKRQERRKAPGAMLEYHPDFRYGASRIFTLSHGQRKGQDHFTMEIHTSSFMLVSFALRL